MRRILGVLLILIVVFCLISTTRAEYSSGYRMGLLAKISEKGWMTKSTEGEILLGRDSFMVWRGDGDAKQCFNPWKFSAPKEPISMLSSFAGQYVWVKYEQVQINNPLKYDTDYRIIEIYKPDRSLPKKDFYEIPPNFGAEKSEGIRVGRIVKISKKGRLIKTWETIIQEGKEGSSFIEMSITDEGLFNYMVECLKSAKKGKNLLWDKGITGTVSFKDTRYRIYKVELLTDI